MTVGPLMTSSTQQNGQRSIHSQYEYSRQTCYNPGDHHSRRCQSEHYRRYSFYLIDLQVEAAFEKYYSHGKRHDRFEEISQ